MRSGALGEKHSNDRTPVPPHASGVLRREDSQGHGRAGSEAGEGPHEGGCHPAQDAGAPPPGEELRQAPRTHAAERAGDRKLRAQGVSRGEGDPRKPTGAARDGESLHPEGKERPVPLRPRHVRPLGQRQGGVEVSGLLPGPRDEGISRAHLRSPEPGRAPAIPRRGRRGAPEGLLPGAQHDGQPDGTARRVLRQVAGVGRHPVARLPALASRGGPDARGRDGQLGRRDADDLPQRLRRPVHHGRAELLRDDLSLQHGERTAGRRGTDTAEHHPVRPRHGRLPRSPGRCCCSGRTTTTSTGAD